MDKIKEYKTGKWFICETIDEMEAFYKSRLPAIREAAKNCGYAIGVHGSMRRDLDLIAVPWVQDYSPANILAEAIQVAACGINQHGYSWEEKPNGRIATSFPICWSPPTESGTPIINSGHIDLSIMGYPDGKEL